MRACSVFYSGMFDCEDFILPEKAVYKRNVASDSHFHRELRNFMGDDDVLVADIIAHGQLYKNDDLIVLAMKDCDTMEVGLVQTILIKNSQVYFVCKVYTCIRNRLQYFESQNCDEYCKYVHFKNIVDYKPLIKRGTISKFVFMLHHRVSFKYE